MKDILEAFTNRIKSPVFGYFISAFVAINWKVIFYLFVADKTVPERFEYIDINTNHYSILVMPLIIGVLGALLYPWINYIFIRLVQKPNELRQIVQLTNENKILVKKQELEEIRGNILESKELELIQRARRDEEIKSLGDEELRESLQKQIDEMRNEVKSNIKDSSVLNTSQNRTDLVDIYMELGKMYKEKGDVSRANEYFKQAAKIRERGG